MEEVAVWKEEGEKVRGQQGSTGRWMGRRRDEHPPPELVREESKEQERKQWW